MRWQPFSHHWRLSMPRPRKAAATAPAWPAGKATSWVIASQSRPQPGNGAAVGEVASAAV